VSLRLFYLIFVHSAWIEERIKVNSVHPQHSDAPFRQLHHYALLFHDAVPRRDARSAGRARAPDSLRLRVLLIAASSPSVASEILGA
jgi:hypothetical protein